MSDSVELAVQSAREDMKDCIYRELFEKIFGYAAGHGMNTETVMQWVHDWVSNRVTEETWK